MIEKLINILTFLLAAYLGFGLLLYLMQRHFLYFPTQAIQHHYRQLSFNTDGESIKVTVLNTGKERAIIYFGGNGETVDNNAAIFSATFTDHTVYLVNYRGYGGSTGQPGEQGFYSDALFVFDEIKPEYTDISVIGRSLGSGVATFLASKREVNKLILITPFDSIQNVAQAIYRIYPIAFMLKDKYESLGRVASIKAKTLVMIAEKDTIIKVKHSMRLVNAFPASQITWHILSNENHNSISYNEKYYTLLKQFLSNTSH